MTNAQLRELDNLHNEIERVIIKNGTEQTREVLAAWIALLSQRKGETFAVCGRYLVSIRELH